MKSLSFVRLLGLLALLLALAGVPLYGQAGQQAGSQDPAAQSQTSMSPQSAQSSQPTQIFVGKVAKSNRDLVLKGDAGSSYKLDNVDQAKPYVGKNVKVTGTLDGATNTIHITTIEPPSS